MKNVFLMWASISAGICPHSRHNSFGSFFSWQSVFIVHFCPFFPPRRVVLIEIHAINVWEENSRPRNKSTSWLRERRRKIDENCCGEHGKNMKANENIPTSATAVKDWRGYFWQLPQMQTTLWRFFYGIFRWQNCKECGNMWRNYISAVWGGFEEYFRVLFKKSRGNNFVDSCEIKEKKYLK